MELLLTVAVLVIVVASITPYFFSGSKEILEEALMNFEGTVLFISHDRYFINKVATKIVEFTPHALEGFDGNYDHYLSVIHEKKEVVKKVPLTYLEQKARTQALRKLQNNVRNLEKEISKLEAKIEKLSTEQTSDEVVNNYVRYNEIGDEIAELEMSLMEKMDEWERANEELEAMNEE